MNQEKKELIQRILASQNKQLQVDAIKMVEQGKSNVPNEKKAIKIVKEHLVRINKNKFPVLDAKQRVEKRRYTQSFKEALEEEKKKQEERKRQEEARKEEERKRQEIEKLKQQRRIDQVMRAYEAQQITLENYNPSFLERLQQAYKKWKAALENQKEVLSSQQEHHKKFMQSLQVPVNQTMQQHTTQNQSEKDKEEER